MSVGRLTEHEPHGSLSRVGHCARDLEKQDGETEADVGTEQKQPALLEGQAVAERAHRDLTPGDPGPERHRELGHDFTIEPARGLRQQQR